MGQTIFKLGLALLVYFSPVKEIFVLMIIFVAADLITGIVAARFRNIPRTSRRGRKSVVKVLCYIGAVLLAFYAEQVLQVEWFASHRYIAGLICVVEFISILENLAVISGHPVFLKIIRLVRGKASEGDNIIKEIIHEKNEIFDPVFRAGHGPDGMPMSPSGADFHGSDRHGLGDHNRDPPRHDGMDRGRQ